MDLTTHCGTCDRPFEFFFSTLMRNKVAEPPVLGHFAQCPDCKLLRLDEPLCTPDDDYQNDDYHLAVDRDDTAEKYRSRYEAYGAQIAGCLKIPPGANVVDIGAGGGIVLDSILALRPSCGTAAVEPNDKFRGYIESERKHHAFKDIPDAKAQLGRYTADRVLLVLVLEHVSDPWQLLRDARELLTPDGVLHVVVPSLNIDMAWNEPRYRRAWFCAQHRWYYSFESLGRMLNACGYAVHGEPEYWNREDGWVYHAMQAKVL